jgi:hypothetical protein
MDLSKKKRKRCPKKYKNSIMLVHASDYLSSIMAFTSLTNAGLRVKMPEMSNKALLDRSSAAIFLVKIGEIVCYMYSSSHAGTSSGCLHVVKVIEKYTPIDVLGIIAEVNLSSANSLYVRQDFRRWLKTNKMFPNLDIGPVKMLLFMTNDMSICIKQLCDIIAAHN